MLLVTLVNLRGGQDSGYFFLQPSVDALTYAGDHGIDVVNMSYFIDPWLYNCRGLAEDTPAQTADQVAIIEAAQRALDYAHMHGVTLVGAAGNSLTDLTMPKPVVDTQSPNFPLHMNHPGPSTTAVSTCRRRATTSSASRRSARARSRPTTRTTATARSTSPRRAAGRVTIRGTCR